MTLRLQVAKEMTNFSTNYRIILMSTRMTPFDVRYYKVLENTDLVGPINMLTLTSYVKLASSHSLKVICN